MLAGFEFSENFNKEIENIKIELNTITNEKYPLVYQYHRRCRKMNQQSGTQGIRNQAEHLHHKHPRREEKMDTKLTI